MVITIHLPEEIESQLRLKAQNQQRTVEDLALNILRQSLLEGPSPEEVVTRIKSLSHNEKNIRHATGSLAEALRNSPEAPEFDLETWKEQWAAVEAEMKALTSANKIAEGHGG